jgi:hypothetical protein
MPVGDPILGDNGYPSEQELTRIREWDTIKNGYRALMAYVRDRWTYADMGYWSQEGDRFALSTGGWSGNESIIDELHSNFAFWAICFVSHHAGGHYVFDVRDFGEPDEDGSRYLSRDPETPLERECGHKEIY